MKTIKYIIASIMILILLTPSGSAMAAGCNGTSCNGKDPHLMGCDGSTSQIIGTVIWSGPSGTLWTSLRYSPSGTCYANWTKTWNQNNNVRHLRAELTKDDAIFTIVQVDDSSSYSLIWSPMNTAANRYCSIGRMGFPNSSFDTFTDPTCG